MFALPGVFLGLLLISVGLMVQLQPATKPPQLFDHNTNLQLLMDLSTNFSDSDITCDECSAFYMVRYCHVGCCPWVVTPITWIIMRVHFTLNMRGPSYLGLTGSISWLLMPWLLMSPEHQQPWYWLYRIYGSFSYLRNNLRTCVISMWRNDTKCKCMFMFPLKNLARKGLIVNS